MKYLGAHVSAQGGVHNAPLRAKEIGATAFALFTKNQMRWKENPLQREERELFIQNLELSRIDPRNVLPHDGYLINLGNPVKEKWETSLKSFIDEAKRVEFLDLKYLNFHPGSHLREISEEECLDRIAEAMNITLKETEGVTLVVEGTAGQGSNVGYKFEHLRYLIEKSIDQSRIGVCLDTCHTFAAGYDLRTKETFDLVMEEFEKTVSFAFLKGVHLNDAKSSYGSRVDRHESLGKGNIGLQAFEFIMKDPRFDGIPLILETPNPALWTEEINQLYSFCKG